MIRTFLNFQVQHNIAYKSHKTHFESIHNFQLNIDYA